MTKHPQPLSELRNLGGIETVFWLMDQNHQTHFCIVAEVAGETSESQWLDALTLIGSQSPLVSAQILTAADGRPFFATTVSRGVPLQVAARDRRGWEEHVADELALPFDVASDPLVRGRLLHDQERSVLILTFHHAVADGSSASIFLREVLRVAAGLAVKVGTTTTSLEHAIDQEGWPDIEFARGTSGDIPPPGYRRAQGSRATILSRHLSIDATAKLRARARAEGATVHAILCAAAARAYSMAAPGDAARPRVMTPIDVRRRLLLGTESLGLFVSATTTRLDEQSADIWDDAREFSARLGVFKDPTVLAANVRGVRALVAELPSVEETAAIWAKAFGAEILLTNLATVAIPDHYGSLVLERLWGPAVSMGIESEQTIGVITLGGRMNLLHTSYEPADGFLDVMVCLLLLAAT
ncbi:condensation domain-containing protein [Sphingomonas sp. UYP23]